MNDHTHDERAVLERQRRTAEAGAELLVSIRRMIAMLEGPPDDEPDVEPVDLPAAVFTFLAMAEENARLEDENQRLQALLTDATSRLCELEGRR